MNILYFSFIYLLFHLYLSIYFYIIYNSYLEFYVFHFYLLISLSLSIYLSTFLFIYSCCFELKISTFPKHSRQNACFKNRLRTHNMGILFIRPTGYSGSVLHAQLDAFVCTYLPVSALLLFATKIDEAACTWNNCGMPVCYVVESAQVYEFCLLFEKFQLLFAYAHRVLPNSWNTRTGKLANPNFPLNPSSIIVLSTARFSKIFIFSNSVTFQTITCFTKSLIELETPLFVPSRSCHPQFVLNAVYSSFSH